MLGVVLGVALGHVARGTGGQWAVGSGQWTGREVAFLVERQPMFHFDRSDSNSLLFSLTIRHKYFIVSDLYATLPSGIF